MPIDSIANLRHLSQARGSFVRLEQGTDRLQTTTVRARFWQWSHRSQEKAGNRAAAERVRDSYQRNMSAAGYGQLTTEIGNGGPWYFAEDYHQQYLDANPHGYCPVHATGIPCTAA